MSNLFACGPALITRIAAQVPTLAHVSDVSGLEPFENGPPLPAVVIMPDSAEAQGNPDDGDIQRESQRWQLVLMVDHHQSDAGDMSTVEQAGELLHQLLTGLIGWRPESGYSACRYAGRAEPYYEPGYAEFPVYIETGLLIAGGA